MHGQANLPVGCIQPMKKHPRKRIGGAPFVTDIVQSGMRKPLIKQLGGFLIEPFGGLGDAEQMI